MCLPTAWWWVWEKVNSSSNIHFLTVIFQCWCNQVADYHHILEDEVQQSIIEPMDASEVDASEVDDDDGVSNQVSFDPDSPPTYFVVTDV